MEYENFKNLQRENEDSDADTLTNPLQHVKASVTSAGSTQSISGYQMFFLEGDSEQTSANHSTEDEHSNTESSRSTSVGTTYSYPGGPKDMKSLLNKRDEEEYTYATTADVVPKQKLKSLSVTDLPSTSTLPLSSVDQTLPLPSAAIVGEDQAEQPLPQLSDIVDEDKTHPGAPQCIKDQPQPPSINVSDSPFATQMSNSTTINIAYPVKEDSNNTNLPQKGAQNDGYSLVNPNRRISNSKFQAGRRLVASVKPLVMNVLPLYLCMDDGKIYADQNATSIPTHHLVEVTRDLGRSVPHPAKLLPPLPLPMTTDTQNSVCDDLLTTPNPVYETVPKAIEMGAISTQPDRKVYVSTSNLAQSSLSLLPVHVTSSPSTVDASRKLSLEITDTIDHISSTTDMQNEQSAEYNTGIDQECETESISHDKVKPTASAQSINRPIKPASTDEPVDGSQTVLWPGRRYSYGRRTNILTEPVEEVHSYYYYTIVAAIVVGLCLNFVVLLACFLPALWFANKASQNKHEGRTADVKKYSRKIVILNIVGIVFHILFIITIVVVFFALIGIFLNNRR